MVKLIWSKNLSLPAQNVLALNDAKTSMSMESLSYIKTCFVIFFLEEGFGLGGFSLNKVLFFFSTGCREDTSWKRTSTHGGLKSYGKMATLGAEVLILLRSSYFTCAIKPLKN